MARIEQTAFGAAWSTPARTASVLRAHASAEGLELRPVDELQAAAGALAAHAWACAVGAKSLTVASSTSTSATAAAAQVLARAAGHATWHLPLHLIASVVDVEPLSCPARTMKALRPGLDWVREQFTDPHDVAAVLAHAGMDLISAETSIVAACGWALLGEAEATLVGP